MNLPQVISRFFVTLTRVDLSALGRSMRLRLRPGRYRPERHYMRGAGPKSKTASTEGSRTTELT